MLENDIDRIIGQLSEAVKVLELTRNGSVNLSTNDWLHLSLNLSRLATDCRLAMDIGSLESPDAISGELHG
jgi:hypothetical protein